MSDDAKTPPALTRGEGVVRMTAIGGIVLAVTVGFAYAGAWLTPERLTPVRLIDTFEQVNGDHPGFRRNHAKGACIAGSFESGCRGARLSKAAVFVPGRVPVIGSFAPPDDEE
jgi:catalase